jgi:hypothetical protein
MTKKQRQSDEEYLLVECILMYQRARPSERLTFLRKLIPVLSSQEIEEVSLIIGTRESKQVFDDGKKVAAVYHDIQFLSQLKMCQWLEGRNKTLLNFLIGIACEGEGIPVLGQSNLSLLALTVELIYKIRNNKLILPVSFLQSLYIYTKTGSKLASDMSGKTSAGGGYKTMQRWMSIQSEKNQVAFPDSDVMILFDNEQVVRYCRSLDALRMNCTAVITMTAFVILGKLLLQNNGALKPPLLMRSKDLCGNAKLDICLNNPKLEALKEKINITGMEMYSATSTYFCQATKVHEETFQKSVQEVIDSVKKSCSGSSGAFLDDIDIELQQRGNCIKQCLESDDITDHEDPVQLVFIDEGEHVEVSVQPYSEVPSSHEGKKEVVLVDPAS